MNLMNIDTFAQHIEAIHWRLAEMYRGASTSIQQPDVLLPAAYKELGTASEALQVAVQELLQQTEELTETRTQVEAERQRYRDLFEFMPNAYLVTDALGKIQEANRAAAALLNVESSYLLGKLLIAFIPPQARPAFRAKLSQLHNCDWVQEWVIPLQPRSGSPLDASLTVAPVRDLEGNLVTLRCIVRDITERQRTLKLLGSNDFDLSQDRPRQFYCKGEIIPLEPQMIWLVCQGLVKLSTMSENGDEVLVGLTGRSMPFGSSLTSLLTYQATVLSDNVQLVGISLSEIAASSRLTQALLPQISNRLRQTELLLAIAGRRHVKERLHYFLMFLKKEMGQKVAEGTRLNVRLTHQDFADACCTTRVTITRLLGKLQQQGKISFDARNHIIIKD